MSDIEEPATERRHGGPHSGKHPIPTIQGYREQRKELRGQMHETEEAQRGPEDESKPRRAFESAKAVIKGEDHPKSQFDPYPSVNRNYADRPERREGQLGYNEEPQADGSESGRGEDDSQERGGCQDSKKGGKDDKGGKSATETVAGTLDPKEKRKAMKKTKRHGGGREVTDPVTHLPIIIHDKTEKDLKYSPENEPEPGTDHRTATGVQGASKSDEELEDEREEMQRVHEGTQKLFPPPSYDNMRQDLAAAYQRALVGSLGAAGLLVSIALVMFFASGGPSNRSITGTLFTTLGMAGCLALAALIVTGMSQWVGKKASEIFSDETWDAARREEKETVDASAELPESVQWLNSLLASIWPLINPDLFTSLGDTLEDVMQASLPKTIKMVAVEDMGQGSEAIRILGVRWLPTGAASQSVDSDGKLQKPIKDNNQSSDRTDPQGGAAQGGKDNDDQEGRENESDEDKKQREQEEQAIREGMEAEEGDFVNMELAFAYRSRSSGKSLKAKAKNAHLYLKFYLPGGVAVPVWVELRGVIATARLRLQLTPDPPFISLCTLTFLGQPRASLSCVPLSKHSLNLMDVPLISSFVQSAIDAALAEYVAPKSLTLNLKDMLVGEDFKKNTTAHGVVWIYIKHARGFKEGDGGVGSLAGSSDAYVTVSWGKFGKPVASTRIIEKDQAPSWHEYSSILVTPEELNADEKVRLQLWDSDKWTADDDLGRVEVDLKELIHNRETHNRFQDREDNFVGEDADEKMPGSLVWSVGYFAKTHITDQQLEQQTVNEDIRSKDQLKKYASDLSETKLRESGKPRDDPELEQQKAQDIKDLEDEMIISAPPSTDFVSGILSVQIHNITGLEVQKLNKKDKKSKNKEDEAREAEESDEMPDSYCTIVLNHAKIYRSRTKPKNSKPFFNAGTERFVRDWRNTEVIVSVRGARDGEDDPLIGMVYLPLWKMFSKKSQLVENFPLVGGIGFGRVRISMVWRCVEMKMPKHLTGWDCGTLEIRGQVKAKSGLDSGFVENRLSMRTNTGKAKFYASGGDEHTWQLHKKKKQQKREGEEEDSAFLAVRKRYASCLVLEFRESKLGPDKTPAFAVLWLNELFDEEDQTVTLKVWKGGKDNLRRAETSCGYDGTHPENGDDKEDGSDEEKESAKPLGEVELTVRFWRGLSGYHKSYAAKSKNRNMRDVMECLDTIADEDLAEDPDDDSDDSDGSDSDSGDSSENTKERKKKLKVHTNDDDSTPSNSDPEDDLDKLKPTSQMSELKKGVSKIFRSPVDGATTAATGIVGAGGHNDPDDGKRGIRSEMRDYKDHHRQLHRKHRGVMQWRPARQVDHLGGKLGQLKGGMQRVFSHGEKESGIETEV